MTKPAVPPPARHEVVEIEAMDVAEWESGQRTPQAADANLAELVRKTAAQPEPPARVQTVARERAPTQIGTQIGAQIGAPVIPRPPSRARTEPPGPPPKPARSRTSGGGAPPPARAIRVPDIPAAPVVEPRRSPAPTTSSGIDFSLPITATSPGMPAAPEPRRSPAQTPVGGVDFSLPITATGEASGPASKPRSSTPAIGEISGGTGFAMPAVEATPRPSEPPRPRAAVGSASELSRTATAASESGARPPAPEPEPLPPTPVPSPFAEPSHVGPGHNASPAGGAEPNTAWPPRPIPIDLSSQPSLQPPLQPPRLAAPDPSIQRSQRPGRDDGGGADRLKVALTRRRLWWIGGGLASASLAGIVAAVLIPNPDALPPEASEADGAQVVQATGPRRDSRPQQPVDRAAADLRDRVRIARNAAAAAASAATTAPAAVDRRLAQPALAADPAMQVPPGETAAASRTAGKKPVRKLVVDYTSRPNEPAPPSLVAQSEEDPAIGQARGAYTAGNQRLFVGDLDGAVRAYRHALELYPGYVGGYRGLGLAYEELGDTANALAALRAYVLAVPSARDVALIRKRIAHLQRR